MYKSRVLFNLLAGSAVSLAVAAGAQAQANRTFVSTHGSDSNTATNCGPSAPCRNFSAAISVLNPGGEVVVLDSGGYGNGGTPTVIGKALTIDATGVHAAATAGPGNDVFDITAGSADVVVLRGLAIIGAGHSGLNGVNISSAGTVHVEYCEVQGFSNDGIHDSLSASGRLFAYETVFRDNSHDGIFISTSSGTASAYIHDCDFSSNGGSGVEAGAGSMASVVRSAAFHNGTGFMADTAGSAASLVVSECHAVNNTTGISANGASASLSFAYTLVTQNGTGLSSSGGAALLGSSPGTSVVNGNTTNGSSTGTVTLQ
jgi:hypothetical protein